MENLKDIFFKKLFEKYSMEELKKLKQNIIQEFNKIKHDKLEKKEDEIIISDLDDTIFSTNERFIFYPELKKLRGEKGNKYIINNIGLEEYIEKNYKNKIFPNNISSQLKEKKDLILTAGIQVFQKLKLKEIGLDKINYIVTSNSSEKILALLKYIILDLKYIPKKIIIYEDRPEFFIYFKEFLENFLETNIEIFYVEMNGNNIKPKIKKI